MKSITSLAYTIENDDNNITKEFQYKDYLYKDN